MSNMVAYLIVNGYDDQTLCVLKVLKIAHFVSANSAKEREWWFWFRKMADSKTNHVLLLGNWETVGFRTQRVKH